MLTTQTTFDEITGGWASLLQGGIGSLIGTLLGVLGAFYVAFWTTRHELERDRQQRLEQARVSAAERINSLLYEMAEHLKHLNPNHRFYSDQSWAGSRVGIWMELSGRLRRTIDDDGPILPGDIRAALIAFRSRLDAVYVVTEHPNAAPFFEINSDEHVEQARTTVDTLIDRLIAYRAAVYNPPAKIVWYRRPWVGWTVAAVVGLASMLVFVLG